MSGTELPEQSCESFTFSDRAQQGERTIWRDFALLLRRVTWSKAEKSQSLLSDRGCLSGFVGAERVDALAVMPDKSVPANNRKLFEHLHSILQVAHARPRVVGPADGYFDNAEAPLDGDEEYLGVETPALDGLKLENGMCGP